MKFLQKKKINKARVGIRHSHLSRMAEEDLREKVIFDRRPKGSERTRHVTLWEKSIPDRGIAWMVTLRWEHAWNVQGKVKRSVWLSRKNVEDRTERLNWGQAPSSLASQANTIRTYILSARAWFTNYLLTTDFSPHLLKALSRKHAYGMEVHFSCKEH